MGLTHGPRGTHNGVRFRAQTLTLERSSHDHPDKTITLRFEVPADLDTPSEVRQQMKDILLEGLWYKADVFKHHPQERRILDALLTES